MTTNTYLEHPAEETLERYLMHRSDEQEVELVETHTLACNYCVDKLEALEIQIAATKLALQNLHNEEVEKRVNAPQKAGWRSWLTVPKLSMAGGLAALVVAVGLVAPMSHQNTEETVNLSVYRGLEVQTIHKGHDLKLNLNAQGLTQSPVNLELRDESGNAVWHGSSTIANNQIEAKVPAIKTAGSYTIDVYGTSNNEKPLREFAVRVQ